MKAWQLLDSPEKWTQYEWARGSNGEKASETYPPVCWCIFGAVKDCYSGISFKSPWVRLQNKLDNPVKWNDAPERTYEEVYAVLKELDI